MATPEEQERHERRKRALARERHGQVRGLLLLAALVLAWVVYRALPLGFFHAGWWRP